VPRTRKKDEKILSVAGVIRQLDAAADELEALVGRVRTLASHLDRHRARAIKRKRRRSR
jgi:ABC-type transporter Mla subunit MlaD